jgi:hypothetical protein
MEALSMVMSLAMAMSAKVPCTMSTMHLLQLLLSKAEVDADAVPKSNTTTIHADADAASRTNKGLSCLQEWGTMKQCQKKLLIHLQK